MPNKVTFPQRPDSHPMIYAYSENNPMYAGMLKIGYTKHDVELRVGADTPLPPQKNGLLIVCHRGHLLYWSDSSISQSRKIETRTPGTVPV